MFNDISCLPSFQVVVTEVLGSGKFYVQQVGDQKVASIQQQLASLNVQEAPVIGAFNPKKGDIVLAQFSADNSWNRAMVSSSFLTFADIAGAKLYAHLHSVCCCCRGYALVFLNF